MLFKSKDKKPEVEPLPNISQPVDNQALIDKINLQQEIIKEMFKLVIMISEHKNYGFIQRQRDLLQLLLDKLPKV